MKTAYNYLLFRIYGYYKDRKKETGRSLLFSVAIASSLLLVFNSMTLYFNFQLYGLVPEVPNELYIVGYCAIVLFCNYYFIVKKKNFLNYNFQKDKLGGYLIIVSILLTALLFIVVANLNREKIANKKKDTHIDNVRYN